MPRWSRRWAAGEANKDQLREILEAGRGDARRQGQHRAADRRLLRGLHGRGAGEQPRREAASSRCSRRSTRIRSAARPAEDHRRAARDRRSPCRSSCIGDSDDHNPSTSSRSSTPPALGMPDRDYYLKDRRALQGGAREVSRVRAALFELAGSNRGAREGGRRDRHAHGDALAQALARQRRVARSEGDRSQDVVRASCRSSRRAFDWSALLRRASRLPPGELNVTEPEFMKEVDRQLARDLARRLEDVPAAGTCSIPPRLRCPTTFVQEEFAFNGAYPQRRAAR